MIKTHQVKFKLHPFYSLKNIFFQSTTSADGLWLTPDNVVADQRLSCSFSALTETIKGKVSVVTQTDVSN